MRQPVTIGAENRHFRQHSSTLALGDWVQVVNI
jgi:hypothetical protein